MRNSAIAGLAVAALLVILAGLGLTDKPEQAGSGPALAGKPVTGVMPPADTAEQSAASTQGQSRGEAAGKDPVVEPADAMRSQFADIADAYRTSSRFPAYSRPLGKNDWQLLNPRGFVPREMPVEGAPDVRVTIEVPHFVHDVRTPLPVRVLVAAPTPAAASAAVRLGRGGAAVPLGGLPAQGGLQVFEGRVPEPALAVAGAGEVMLVAELVLSDGQTVSATAMVQLYQSAADLAYLGDAYVEGADLMVPAHFNVFTPGYFRIQANLMDAESGEPVSHISSAFALSEQQTVGLLKVHAETLRAMQAPGPYLLTGFNIVRSPSRPGETTGYGSAAADTFPVNGFSLDGYSDEPYVDEAASQRQDFLDRISSGAN